MFWRGSRGESERPREAGRTTEDPPAREVAVAKRRRQKRRHSRRAAYGPEVDQEANWEVTSQSDEGEL